MRSKGTPSPRQAVATRMVGRNVLLMAVCATRLVTIAGLRCGIPAVTTRAMMASRSAQPVMETDMEYRKRMSADRTYVSAAKQTSVTPQVLSYDTATQTGESTKTQSKRAKIQKTSDANGDTDDVTVFLGLGAVGLFAAAGVVRRSIEEAALVQAQSGPPLPLLLGAAVLVGGAALALGGGGAASKEEAATTSGGLEGAVVGMIKLGNSVNSAAESAKDFGEMLAAPAPAKAEVPEGVVTPTAGAVEKKFTKEEQDELAELEAMAGIAMPDKLE